MSEDKPEIAAWPGVTKAAELSGVSRRQLERYAEAGKLETADYEGRRVYNPDDLYDLPGKRADSSELLKRCIEMLDVQNKHIDRLLGNLDKPMTVLLDGVKAETAGMRERIASLESVHLDAVKHLEELSSEKAIRDIAVSEHERREQRKDQGFTLLKKELLPRIMAGVGSGAIDVKNLLQSLSDDQIAVLTEGDFLSDDQTGLIKRLRKTTGAPTNGAGSATNDDSTN